MKITPDTNLLVRMIIADDEAQNELATETLKTADLVAIGVPALCELVWVLDRRYGVSHVDIAQAIRGLLEAGNVVVNRPAVEAGLNLLGSGGDFADGAIAYEGQWLGAETFVSFDKKAVKLLNARGRAARVLE